MKYTFEIVAPNGESVVSDSVETLRGFIKTKLPTVESRTLVGNLIQGDLSVATWETLTGYALEAHGVRVTRSIPIQLDQRTFTN